MKKKNKLEPIIKNHYRKTIRPVKKAAILLGLSLFTLAATPIVYNAGREIYEEVTSENQIIDFDYFAKSVVIKNKDFRNEEELFNDVLENALNINGIETVNSPNLTVTEKKEMLEELVFTMAETAGVKIDEIRYYGKEDQYNYFKGYFIPYSNNNFVLTSNEININESIFNDFYSPKQILVFGFHEMIHAIEHLNIKTNANINDFERTYYDERTVFDSGKTSYYTNGPEITANFLTHRFETEINKMLSERTVYEYTGARKIINEVLDEFITNYRTSELKNYETMTIGQIMLTGIKTNMEKLGIDCTYESVLNSYTFNIIKSSIPNEILTLKYNDFKNNLDEVFYFNIDEKISSFEDTLYSYTNSIIPDEAANLIGDFGSIPGLDFNNTQIFDGMKSSLVNEMLFFLKSYYYNENNYSEDTKAQILKLVEDNIDLVDENSSKYEEFNSLYSDILHLDENVEENELDDEINNPELTP